MSGFTIHSSFAGGMPAGDGAACRDRLLRLMNVETIVQIVQI
jgi:hypothetical protein